MEQLKNKIDVFYRAKNYISFLEDDNDYKEECRECELHEKINDWNNSIDKRRHLINDLKKINNIY